MTFGMDNKTPLLDLVKWDEAGVGDDKLMVHKHPKSDLTTLTQLVVNEGQEAIFFKGGKRFDTFGAGRHTLSSQNLPLIGKLIRLPFGGQTPFSAEVWFVNKTIPLDIKWGTATPIQLEDPKYGIIVPVQAFGQFGLQITESGMFVTKLVGATSAFTQGEIRQYFKGMLLARLKSSVSRAITQQKISILDISNELHVLSLQVESELQPEFAEYGLALKAFRIMSINVPEEDESFKMLKTAKANAVRRQIEGLSVHEERTYDVLQTAAGNQGAGGALFGAGLSAGMGASLGVGLAQAVPRPGTPAPATPPPYQPPAPNPFGSAPPQFFIHLNGQQLGPYDVATLAQGVPTGQFTRETPVWRTGMAAWLAAGQVPELASLFASTPPPIGGPPPFGGTK